jgi:predicted RNase H-like nuclease (RuvC/YqgF family)
MTYAILLFLLAIPPPAEVQRDPPTPAAMEQTIKELVKQNAALQAEVVRLETALSDCEADVDRSVAREKENWAIMDHKSQMYDSEIKRLSRLNRWKGATRWFYAAAGFAVGRQID